MSGLHNQFISDIIQLNVCAQYPHALLLGLQKTERLLIWRASAIPADPCSALSPGAVRIIFHLHCGLPVDALGWCSSAFFCIEIQLLQISVRPVDLLSCWATACWMAERTPVRATHLQHANLAAALLPGLQHVSPAGWMRCARSSSSAAADVARLCCCILQLTFRALHAHPFHLAARALTAPPPEYLRVLSRG